MKRSDLEFWQVVRRERLELIADLERIEPAQWHTASLCREWDVHDVLAHLVDTAKTTRLGFIRRMLAARFNFDADNAVGVSREKASDPQKTLDEFRAVSLRTSTPPAALATRLVEAFAHGEDIRRPLGIVRDYPPEHVATALAYQLKTSVKFGGGKELAQGWHLVATDTVFNHGGAAGHAAPERAAGAEVRAKAITLLLSVSGRPVAAHDLGGTGAQAFAAMLEQRC